MLGIKEKIHKWTIIPFLKVYIIEWERDSWVFKNMESAILQG